MKSIVVVDNPKSWPLDLVGVRIVSARDYLGNYDLANERRIRVFNLCRSYRYQSLGYYVSLLAMARGHTPLPSIATIQDMRSISLSRVIADELGPIAQRLLQRLKTDDFVLSVYFGKNLAKQYDELSGRIFRLFNAPLIRARFHRDDDGWWLRSLKPISMSEIPDAHRAFVAEAAQRFFERNRMPKQSKSPSRYDLAILLNGQTEKAPSNQKAIDKFIKAARKQHMQVECITKEDYGRLGEFDGLFIRETTQVDHYTYRFARRAAAEKLVVIDDPESIIKCTNKVYLAELMERQRVPIPETRVLSRENRSIANEAVTFPVIVKQPDSAFSQGVFKAKTPEELEHYLELLFEDSELVILQEFVQTPFDWRIGVLNRHVLYACKYHMAKAHWQIAKTTETQTTYGNVEAVPVNDVPSYVLKAALRAANAIGDGLYGVDVKQIDNRAMVIEVNDNPNIDAGFEDALIGDELYDRLVDTFIQRIDKRRGRMEPRS